jgi:ABC-type lipoprotein release transport system permease subunit
VARLHLASLVLLAVAGSVSAQTGEPPEILVSRQLAESEKITHGQVVNLATDPEGKTARRYRVAGIYEPVPDPAELGQVPRELRMHLPDLLSLIRPPDVAAGAEHVSGINIALVDPDDARPFAREVAAAVPGTTARPAREATGSASTFLVLERFHLAIAIVTIAASTVFLLALTIMLVEERRETVGVLRLIGLRVRRILVQVLIEGLLIAAVGAAFGLVLALFSEGLINAYFQWRYDTALVFVRVTEKVAAITTAIAVPLGALATVGASWALLRRNALWLARR